MDHVVYLDVKAKELGSLLSAKNDYYSGGNRLKTTGWQG
jgi:hypothetical protein